MKKKIKKENLDKSETTNDVIDNYFKNIINTDEIRNKYLEVLGQRITENNIEINRLLMIMLFVSFAFPLILNANIREINIGPFILKDISFALLIIPLIFSFCFYKVVNLQIILSYQNDIYINLLSVIFKHRKHSKVNLVLRPFFFLRNSVGLHLSEDSTYIKIILKPIKVILTFIILIFPYYLTFYFLSKIYSTFSFVNIHEIILFVIPIVFSIFSILIKYQVLKRE